MSSFYRRRFMHILPPFICFLLLYSLLPLLWGGMTWEQSLNDLKLLPFNFPSMAGHLWLSAHQPLYHHTCHLTLAAESYSPRGADLPRILRVYHAHSLVPPLRVA